MEDLFAQGVRHFDAGEFFEAHEAWEQQWRIATNETERRFFQGLIQIAAGFHKLLVMRSAESAARLLARGLAKLDACPALVADTNLGDFCEQVRRCTVDLAAGRFRPDGVPRMNRRMRA